MVGREASTAAVREENLDALVTVLDEIRRGDPTTRPDLIRRTGLGRSVVVQRVAELIDRGLVVETGLGSSSGGRAPRALRFVADAGHILVADLGATSIAVGVADLAGRILTRQEETADIMAGPEIVLDRVEAMLSPLVARTADIPGRLWGIGLGVPGPVEFATGRPSAPPIMPGWDGYPIRERFADRHGVPVWVDNDANLMALGEYRSGSALGHETAVLVKLGSGIGAGILIKGRLHRGAEGSAGDIGHIQISEDPSVICRCGNIGCLEALSGGFALARDGAAGALDGSSTVLGRLIEERGRVDAVEVGWAAAHGDAFSLELITEAGRRIGRVIATLVNTLNPSLVVIGGGVSNLGDVLLAAIRESVYARSLPLATRNLRIVRSSLDDQAGLVGAAQMVADELFARSRIGAWLPKGAPSGLPEMSDIPTS